MHAESMMVKKRLRAMMQTIKKKYKMSMKMQAHLAQTRGVCRLPFLSGWAYTVPSGEGEHIARTRTRTHSFPEIGLSGCKISSRFSVSNELAGSALECLRLQAKKCSIAACGPFANFKKKLLPTVKKNLPSSIFAPFFLSRVMAH